MKSNNANGIEPISVLNKPKTTPTAVLNNVIGAVKIVAPIPLIIAVFNKSIGANANLRPNVSGRPNASAGIPIVIAGIANNAGKITGCANAKATGAVNAKPPRATGANRAPPNNNGAANGTSNPPNNGNKLKPPSPPAVGAAAVVAAAVVAAFPWLFCCDV